MMMNINTTIAKISFLIVVSLVHNSVCAQVKIVKSAGYLDVRTGRMVRPANIVIEKDIIKSVNPGVLPAATEVIDLGNQILLPGLMDMHVHLDLDFISNYQYLAVTENAAKNALRGAKNAELTLMAGFTTVRDVGQVIPTADLIDVALAEASNEGWIKAPRIIPAGHMIGITGGHADPSMMGGLAEHILEVGPEMGIANGKEEMLQAVRYQIKHGAKVIKMMATAGVMSLEDSVGAQQMSDEEMGAVVQEAKNHGITVAAHAHGTKGIIAAIRAGVTSIEHGSYLTKEAIDLMLANGTYLVPTTGLTDVIAKSYDMMDPKLVAKAKIVLPVARQSVTDAAKAGVKICLGTDAPLIPHGKNATELFAMMDRGMTSLEVLQSATLQPANMLGLKDRGEIREGLLADIIAVADNPIDHIKTMQAVKFVMKGGVIYKREQ